MQQRIGVDGLSNFQFMFPNNSKVKMNEFYLGSEALIRTKQIFKKLKLDSHEDTLQSQSIAMFNYMDLSANLGVKIIPHQGKWNISAHSEGMLQISAVILEHLFKHFGDSETRSVRAVDFMQEIQKSNKAHLKK